jgi:hypothetical protein
VEPTPVGAAPAPAPPAPPVSAPAPPVSTPVATPPPSATLQACARRLTLRLTVPRRSRIVRVSVYSGKRRILSRRGRRLTRLRFKGPDRASFAVKVIETTARHHRLRVLVSYRGCRAVSRRT